MHMGNLAPLLLAAAAGYAVCVVADKQKKKDFRIVGLILGVVIIVLSIFATGKYLLKSCGLRGMRPPSICRMFRK